MSRHEPNALMLCRHKCSMSQKCVRIDSINTVMTAEMRYNVTIGMPDR